MENASKALLMAGGILIAIIIIALLVRTFSTINQFQMSNLSEEEQKKLIAFNEQYTKYLNQYVYGSDVKTLMNKAEITGVTVVCEEPPGDQGEQHFIRHEGSFESGTPAYYTSDTKYYKCTDITFDNNTGKVTSITFENIPLISEVEPD